MGLVNRVIQPIKTQAGMIAAGGGTVTVDVVLPLDSVVRLQADVLMAGIVSGHIDLCSGLPCEAVFKMNAAGPAFVAAGAGSTNPQNSNTAGISAARADADELISGGGLHSTAVWTAIGPNLARLTLTNNGTELACYDIAIYAHHAVYGFSPAELPGLIGWFRADLGITLNITGASQWNDQSGAGDANRNFVQATAAKQPIWTSSDPAFNGQSTLQFNKAAAQTMSSIGAWSDAPVAQPISIFLIGSADISGTEVWLGDPSGLVMETDNLGFYDFAGAFLQKLTPPTGAAEMFGGIFNGGASDLFLNARTAAAAGAAGALGLTTPLHVGTSDGLATAPLNGKIAEIIVCTGILNATAIDALCTYFTKRYGIAIGA